MNDYLLQDYLPGLACTVVAELGVAVLGGLWSERQLGAVVAVNLVTHPALHLALWAAFWWREAAPSWLMVAALEGAVVLAEGAMLWPWLRWPIRKALALSAAMNVTSYLAGLAMAG